MPWFDFRCFDFRCSTCVDEVSIRGTPLSPRCYPNKAGLNRAYFREPEIMGTGTSKTRSQSPLFQALLALRCQPLIGVT